MNRIFARKAFFSAADGNANHHSLKRSLGALDLMMLGVGTVIGAGIFVVTGHAAAANAGPAIVLSFILAGVVCAFAGLCYAEMAAAVPAAGSAYTYAYATMGELVGWIIGWDLILEYSLGATTVAIGWSGYVTSFLADLGIPFPPQLSNAPGTLVVDIPQIVAERLHLHAGWTALSGVQEVLARNGIDWMTLPHVTAVLNVPAMIIVAIMSGVLLIGIKESVWINNIMVFLKVAVVLLFTVVGLSYFSTVHWGGSFIPANTGEFGRFGWSGILRGAGVVFFAFIGFDAISTTGLEAKRPQRDMPIGILGSLCICTLLYVLVALALTGVVHYTRLDVPDPIAVGIDAIGMHWLAPLVKLGAIAGLSSVVLGMLMGQPRIFYAMSRDGLLPAFVSRLHPRFGTPYITTLITGFFVAIAAGVTPLNVVGELVSMGTLFAFAVVCAGVLVLRVSEPTAERPFRAPFVWFVAPMGALVSLLLMAGLPLDTWVRHLIWIGVGVGVYFAYGFHYSKLRSVAAD